LIVGQLTGLEPVTTYVRWYPHADPSHSERANIEGFHLFLSLPSPCLLTDPLTSLPFIVEPKAFHKDSKKNIDDTLKEIKKRYAVNDQKRISWEMWYDRYLRPWDPNANDVLGYLTKLSDDGIKCYTVPLLQVFCNPSILVPQWSTDLTPIDNLFFLTQGSFQWPDLCQLAMPSVEQRFNKNPPKPRLLLYNENELVKRREKYIIESDGYYKDRGVLSL
jgi:hypothetical protein